MMIFLHIKSVSSPKTKKKIAVLNSEGESIAGITKIQVKENEKNKSFLLTQNNEEAILGIQKNRILFASYQFLVNGEKFTFKDRTINSILYFCVDGMIHDDKIKFEENWDKHIDIHLNDQHIAVIKPHSFSFGATVLIDEKYDSNFPIFSIICLMYFMYIIYKNETDMIENIIEELI